MKKLILFLLFGASAASAQTEQRIENYWRNGDGDNWSPACMRAQQETALFRPITILFSRRRYRMNEGCDIIRPNVTFKSGQYTFGVALAGAGYEIPTIYCPNTTGVPCIETHYVGTYGGGTYGALVVASDVNARGENFVLDGVNLEGPGSTTGTRENHALHLRTNGNYITNVFIRFFRGVGIRQNCTAGSGTASNNGNCNGTKIDNVRLYDIGAQCLLTAGGDSNVIVFNKVSTNDCGEDAANWSEATTAVTCTTEVCTVTMGTTADFRVDDVVSASGLLDSGGAAANWTRGVITALTPTTLTVDTSYDALNIPNGAFTDGVGTITGRSVNIYESALIGNVYSACSVNGPGAGDGFFSSGGGDSTFIMPYTEGSMGTAVYAPSFIMGGRNNPLEGTPICDGSSGGLHCRPGIQGSYGVLATTGSIIGQLGGDSNTALSWRRTGHAGTFRIQYEQTTSGTGKWEIGVDQNSNNFVPMQIAHEGTITHDRGTVRFPMHTTYFGGSGIAPAFGGGTNIQGSLAWRTINGLVCRLTGTRVFNVSGATAGTPGRLTTGTHNIPSGTQDIRILVDNVGGVTGLADGEYRGDYATAAAFDLYDMNLAATSVSGTYTSGGLAIIARAECFSNAAPTGNNWAIGDVVWNTNPTASNTTGWVCTGAGASPVWRPILSADALAAGLTGATNGALDGNLKVLYQEFTAGVAGTADDVVWTTSMPDRVRLIDIMCDITTAIGGSTVTFRDATGGGGAAVSEAISSAATGVLRHTGTTVLGTIASAGTLTLRRSDRGVAGRCSVSVMRY